MRIKNLKFSLPQSRCCFDSSLIRGSYAKSKNCEPPLVRGGVKPKV